MDARTVGLACPQAGPDSAVAGARFGRGRVAADGTWTWGDDALCGMLGVNRATLGGMPIEVPLLGIDADDLTDALASPVPAVWARPCRSRAHPERSLRLMLVPPDGAGPAEWVALLEDRGAESERQARLAQRESLFQSILDHAPIGIWMLRSDGRLGFVNKAFCDAVGVTEKRFLAARHYGELYEPETAQRCMATDAEAMRTGGVHLSTERLRCADGQIHDLEIRKLRVAPDGGEPIGLIGISVDVTDRLAADNALRMLSVAVEQSSNSMVITDLAGTIVYVNPAFCAATGYSAEKVIGREAGFHRSGLTPASTIADLWQTLAQGHPWQGELLNRRANGEIEIDWTVISPIRDAEGRVVQYLAVQEDVTERKAIEAELKQHRDQLEEMVAARTAELDRARLQAEQANAAKSSFVAQVSHEVRAPLAAIAGLTRQLLPDVHEPAQARVLGTISQAADGLLRIVNDLLDMARIEGGKLSLDEQPFELEQVLVQAMALQQPAAEAKGLRLDLELAPDMPPRLVGDAGRLSQVLINLLSNAVKFTASGRVGLSCRIEPPTGAARPVLRFEVADTGVGIAPEVQSRLFADFEQGSPAMQRRYGGSGLGLAISRRLVQLMGGSIHLHSAVGEGSRFWFTVPLTVDASEPAATPQPRPPRHARVLLADDDPVARELSRRMLEAAGVAPESIELADDGNAALAAARRGGFSLIILDMCMPGRDGPTVAAMMRSLDCLAGVPIVALTGNDSEEDRRRCLEAGMTEVLHKPISTAGMRALVGRRLLAPPG